LISTDRRKGEPLSARTRPVTKGQFGIELHAVQVKKPRVLLFQLQRGLTPRAHLLQLAPKFLVLFEEPCIALEILEDARNARHRGHGPFHVGHDPVDDGCAHPFHARVVDAPKDHQADQQHDDNRHQQSPDGSGIGVVVTVPCHGAPVSGASGPLGAQLS
jgi:hypothetical protein